MSDPAFVQSASSSSCLAQSRIAVAGAGVFGLCVALGCARAGASVSVFDPAPIGANASGVAAGMIAPLGELLYDRLDPSLWRLLLAARDAWRPLETMVPGLSLQRNGCLYGFDGSGPADAAAGLARALGVRAARPPRSAALETDTDWWLDPRAALHQLFQAVSAAGGARLQSALPKEAAAEYDHIIVCTGPGSPARLDIAPVLARLHPIKGHLVLFEGAPSGGPLERHPGLYLTPQPYGVIAGATMEPGVFDPQVDPNVVQALRDRAIALRPSLAPFAAIGAAGVRMAADDGLPVVGPDLAGRAFVAVGARRNGWLFGPLVAEILLAYLTGAPQSASARRLSPARLLERRA